MKAKKLDFACMKYIQILNVVGLTECVNNSLLPTEKSSLVPSKLEERSNGLLVQFFLTFQMDQMAQIMIIKQLITWRL